MKKISIFGLLPCASAAVAVSLAGAALPSMAQTTPPPAVPPVTAPPVTAPPVTAPPVTTPPAAGSPAADHPNGDLPPVRMGSGRRAMRMGTDPEAAKMSTKPVPTTIAAVKEFIRPRVLSLDTRVKTVETTIWSIEGTLTVFESKPDGDFYLVIRDDAGNLMTAELPDPDLEKASPWYKQIAEARKAFTDASAVFKKTAVGPDKKPPRVRIVGAGFFGRPEREEAAPVGLSNGFQLHPVIGFTPLP